MSITIAVSLLAASSECRYLLTVPSARRLEPLKTVFVSQKPTPSRLENSKRRSLVALASGLFLRCRSSFAILRGSIASRIGIYRCRYKPNQNPQKIILFS